MFTRLRSVLSSPAALFWLAILLTPLPLLALNLGWMWKLPHYQYFPFLLIGVGRWRGNAGIRMPNFLRDALSFGMLSRGPAVSSSRHLDLVTLVGHDQLGAVCRCLDEGSESVGKLLGT